MNESVVIDSNLLLLFVVGATSRKYIEAHKRLRHFTIEDFDFLLSQVSGSRLVVTPNTLTETSNLLGHIKEPARTHLFLAFRSLIRFWKEEYVLSVLGSERPEFEMLGLTDAVLLEVAAMKFADKEAHLLTVDLELAVAAQQRGLRVTNFNHIRPLY